MDINGCGFGRGGWGWWGGRETDGKDEKAAKITHERSHWQMKGRRDGGFYVDGGEEFKKGVSGLSLMGARDLK